METTGKKPFLKPENITGIIFLAALGFVAYNYGPGLFWGAVNLAGASVVLGTLGASVMLIAWQRKAIADIWRVGMYKLTNLIYSIDPIAVAWQKLGKMKKKSENIRDSITKIEGSRKNVQRQLSVNQGLIDEYKEKVEALKNLNRPPAESLLLARKAERLVKYNDQLKPIENTMGIMKNGLTKLYDAAQFVIEDKSDELKTLESQYNAVKLGWAAVGKAKSALDPNSEERATLEKMIDMAGTDMSMKLAEMDMFLEQAQPILREVDLNKAIDDDKIQKLVDKWQNGDLDKMVGTIDNLKTKTAIDGNQLVGINFGTAVSGNKYDSLDN